MPEEQFSDRVLGAVDDGFVDQIKCEAGAIVSRIAGGAPIDTALNNFDSILRRTLDAREKARAIATGIVGRAIIAMMLAHSWYPIECCGGFDCHPIACNEVHEIGGGYEWKGVTFKTATPSPDDQCHACVNNNTGEGLCLYLKFGVS